MNKWLNLGIALCLYAIILNVSYAISTKFLLVVLVIPGLFVWWMTCLTAAFWLNATYLSTAFGDNDE
jgi:uncharacterized membrane protein